MSTTLRPNLPQTYPTSDLSWRHLMCAAATETSNVIVASDNKVNKLKPLPLQLKWANCECVSELHIYSHGDQCLVQFEGDSFKQQDLDLVKMCELFCEGATVHLKSCCAATPPPPVGFTCTSDLFYGCPKVYYVYGCTQVVDYVVKTGGDRRNFGRLSQPLRPSQCRQLNITVIPTCKAGNWTLI